METRVLRYFVEAARLGSISRAAESLHVTQPTMTRQLKALEQELGVRLYSRSSCSIRITDDGRRLLERAADILQLVERARAEFSRTRAVKNADLYLGCPESASMGRIFDAIAGLSARDLSVRCHITSGNAPAVLERLEDGRDEIALIFDESGSEKFSVEPLELYDAWGALLPADHPLAKHESMDLDTLATLPLIVSSQAWQQVFWSWYGNRMDSLNVAATFNLCYNAAHLVKSSSGVAVTIGGIVATGGETGLAFVPLEGVRPEQLKLVLRRGRSLSPGCSIVVETIRQRFASGSGRGKTHEEPASGPGACDTGRAR